MIVGTVIGVMKPSRKWARLRTMSDAYLPLGFIAGFGVWFILTYIYYWANKEDWAKKAESV